MTSENSSPAPILILANPTAGAGKGRASRLRLLDAAKHELEKHGHTVHIGLEDESLAIRERAENAARAGAPIIVAAGGDGTVNAVANGILRASNGQKSNTKLGILPMGTGNVFAFNLGLGKGWKSAAKVIREGHTRTIDAGLAIPLSGARGPSKMEQEGKEEAVKERYFLLMAGLGFDAKVIEDTSLRLKFVLRDFAYALRSLQNAVVHRGTQVTLTFPDGTVHSTLSWILMAGNAASYAWAIKFTENARLDDGMLDLCLFPFENKMVSIQQVMQLLMGQHVERGSAYYAKTTSVKIESTPPIPVQLDGDEWGTTPLELKMCPGVLQVFAPLSENSSEIVGDETLEQKGRKQK
ncbi:lipid kinase, YegS/Rv2252/BmrU family [Abditibacterium utsteinense]|uniref:Lipid kinase, YegS/Rv2252/BmrU family n=1 Tax=Abditibacterium utsteinense TaxID=1960156 RepID=A0A2S8SUQ4_9BACT|nr:diacylglycerol kinase family protein [Abditibacterium utsteinense]PQV64521.1 lipid kinase, YegS/Rv2252/BmrU family [Abditibacterium utsteinense]